MLRRAGKDGTKWQTRSLQLSWARDTAHCFTAVSYTHLWDYIGKDNQLWTLEPAADGRWKVRSKLSGRVLDIVGMSQENGASLQIWDDVDGENQAWKFTEVKAAKKPAAKKACLLYTSASPEKIETTVTKPLEAVLGTTGGIKNVSSVSSENASIVILE